MRHKLINIFNYSFCLTAIGAVACGGADDAEPEPTERVGYVTVATPGVLFGPVDEPYMARANFMGFLDDQHQEPECAKQTLGACELVDCPQVVNQADTERVVVVYDAGRITVEGGLRPVVIEPGASGTEATGPAFRGGETLSLRAENGEVPAFEGSLLAPGDVTVSEPRASAGAVPTFALGVDRDATFRWTGGVAGTSLYLRFKGQNASDVATVDATCTFDAGAGEGVVPAALLARLSQRATDVKLTSSAEAKQQLTAGEFSIDFRALARVSDPAGESFWGQVRFE